MGGIEQNKFVPSSPTRSSSRLLGDHGFVAELDGKMGSDIRVRIFVWVVTCGLTPCHEKAVPISFLNQPVTAIS